MNPTLDREMLMLAACLGVLFSASTGDAQTRHDERALAAVHAVISQGPFGTDWTQWSKYRVPKWYRDGKFGIFIHWGVYSVPAFGSEWYPRMMYIQGSPEFEHEVKTYGPQSKFGYKDFIPMFKAEHYNPNDWARMFKEAGAKFVVPVAEHHDGFAMYDCSFTKWDAVKMGPHKDLIGLLAKAVRREGLVFGVSFHRAEHWWFFNGGMKFDSDVRDPRYADFYGPAQPDNTQPNKAFLDDWLARACEIVDKYKPQIFWFDWWIEQPAFKPYLQRFGAYYYDRAHQWHKGVAINYKNEAFPPSDAVLDIERGQLGGIRPEFWQTDTSLSYTSWGYVKGQKYKPAGQVVNQLVDIVSKNGALLLNIGPKEDGTIPDKERQILLRIGKWLKVNGEAIYGTRPFAVYGEGPTKIAAGSFNDAKNPRFTGQDVRYTRKGSALYAIVMAWPGVSVTLHELAASAGLVAGMPKSVTLLGHRGQLKWSLGADGLTVQMPANRPCNYAYSIKFEGFTYRETSR